MAGKRYEFETENMTFTTVLEPLHDKEDQYGGGGILSIVVVVAFMPLCHQVHSRARTSQKRNSQQESSGVVFLRKIEEIRHYR
jgi:hypothetical protein